MRGRRCHPRLLTEDLPAARRRRHHLRVAEAMERAFSDDLPAQAGTIAQHLVEAGSSADRAKLIGYLVLAGKRALESAAVEDALRHLRRAAALEEHAPQVERAEMFFQLGMAERSAGNWSEAVLPWHRAIEIYEELGEAEVIGRICLAAAYSLAWAARFGEAYELAQRGLSPSGSSPRPRTSTGGWACRGTSPWSRHSARRNHQGEERLTVLTVLGAPWGRGPHKVAMVRPCSPHPPKRPT